MLKTHIFIILCLITSLFFNIKCNDNGGVEDDTFDLNIHEMIMNGNPSEELIIPPVYEEDYLSTKLKTLRDKSEPRCYEDEHSNVVVCSEIPSNCVDSCRNENNLLKFDSLVKKIEPFAFREYIFSEAKFNIEFESINEIEEDSFRGAIILHELNLIFNGSVYNDNKLVIHKFAFRGINLQKTAKLNIFINNYKVIEFNEYSLNGFKLLQSVNSNVNIMLNNNENILFSEKSAYGWMELDELEGDDPVMVLNDEIELEDTSSNVENLNKTKLFTININRVKNVKIEKNSFYGLKQEPFSVFQVLVSNFEKVELDENSFSSIEQNNSSKFELNLKNGKYVKLTENLIKNVQQGTNSQFIVLLDSISSSICVPKNTIKNFKQNKNSSLNISFVGNKRNLYVDSSAFVDIEQGDDSFIGLYGHGHLNTYFKSYALQSLTQKQNSFLEVLFTEVVSLTFDDYSLSKIKQFDKSRILIGFKSNGGVFQQSAIVFDKFEQDSNSYFTYDFSQGSNFNLRFPPRIVPRMIGVNQESSSDSNSNNKILESLYPNLGIANRPPHRISLVEYVLESKDFCKIHEIPSDMIIQLAPKTTCSCAIFYLYRELRKSINHSLWLSYAPKCYQDVFHSPQPNFVNIETECNFNNLKESCKEQSSTVVKLDAQLKCNEFTAEKDDYLVSEIRKYLTKDKTPSESEDKTNKNSNTKNDDSDEDVADDVEVISTPNDEDDDPKNKTLWIIAISTAILLLILTILIIILFIIIKLRNSSLKNKRNRLKSGNLSSNSDIDSDHELKNNLTDTKVSLSDDSTNVTLEYTNPIYKKNKSKTLSLDSDKYLLDKNNQLENSEKYNLIVKTEECSSSRAFITKIDLKNMKSDFN